MFGKSSVVLLLLLLCALISSGDAFLPAEEISALEDLIRSFAEISSNTSMYHQTWKEGQADTGCVWEGIGCDENNSTVEQHVNRLELILLDSVGNLPPSISNLTQLEKLIISLEAFDGDLPSSIQQLQSLSELRLSQWTENVTAPIEFPYWIKDMPGLSEIYIWSFNFMGSTDPLAFLPNNSWIVHFSESKIGGTLPAKPLPNTLVHLFLDDTGLSGPIPRWIGSLESLQILDLSRNDLTGSIPEEIGQLDNLITLDLSNNSLTSVPDSINDMAQLYILYLQHNSLSGNFPNLINQTIDWLNLGYNNFSGPIPDIFEHLGSTWLCLNNNNFSGPIPPSLGKIDGLQWLELQNNNLEGNIQKVLRDVPENQISVCTVSYNSPEFVCPDSFSLCCDKYIPTPKCNDFSCVCSSNLEDIIIKNETGCRSTGFWHIGGNATNEKSLTIGYIDQVIVNDFNQSSQANLQVFLNDTREGALIVDAAQLDGTLTAIITRELAAKFSVDVIIPLILLSPSARSLSTRSSQITGSFSSVQVQTPQGMECTFAAEPVYEGGKMAVLLTKTSTNKCTGGKGNSNTNRMKVMGIALGTGLGALVIISIIVVVVAVYLKRYGKCHRLWDGTKQHAKDDMIIRDSSSGQL